MSIELYEELTEDQKEVFKTKVDEAVGKLESADLLKEDVDILGIEVENIMSIKKSYFKKMVNENYANKIQERIEKDSEFVKEYNKIFNK